MKKTIIYSSAIILGVVSLTLNSCKKDDKDINKPAISIVGSNPYYIQKGTSWTDPGATASDDVDGTIVATPSGAVTMSTVGTYTVTYTAKDKAGNTETQTRTVNVVDIAGHYATAVDVSPYPGGTSNSYSEDVYLANDGTGKVNVTKFGDYENGSVYFNLTSTHTFSIPSQVVTCGTAPYVAPRTFSGTGTINTTAPQVTIFFSEITDGVTIDAQDTYTR